MDVRLGCVARDVFGDFIPKGLKDEAEAVFVGKLFVVWQWPQVMYDGTIETFEAVTRPHGSSVIALQEREGVMGFCFARQTQPDQEEPFESLLGGRLDSVHEDPLDAAKRELREEAGMESDYWRLVERADFNRGRVHNSEWVWVARDCRVVGDQKLDAGEYIEVCWRPLAEFPDWLLMPCNRQQYLRNYVFSALDAETWDVLQARLLQ